MRISNKTKRLLEFLALCGLDALMFAANPRGALYGAMGWNSNRIANRHMRGLQTNGLITLSEERATGNWITEITELGKGLALEDIDPEASWDQPWDQRWRTLSFDLPQEATRERRQLNSWLRKRRFGHLQGSLWISHREYDGWTAEIGKRNIDPQAVIFQEAIAIGERTSKQYVAKSWPFAKINAGYAEHIRFLRKNPPKDASEPLSWFEAESALWRVPFELDPFLPDQLLPSGYKAKEAWRLRKKAYAAWSKLFAASEA